MSLEPGGLCPSRSPFPLPPSLQRWLLSSRQSSVGGRGEQGDFSWSFPVVPILSHCSRLLWQVAGLADGDDHVLGLAVTVARHLGHLAHLIHAVGDAVDVAFVAVVIWVGAEDPIWEWRRKKCSYLWLFPDPKPRWEILHCILSMRSQERPLPPLSLSPSLSHPHCSIPPPQCCATARAFPSSFSHFSGCCFLEALLAQANEIMLLILKIKIKCLRSEACIWALRHRQAMCSVPRLFAVRNGGDD